LRNDMYEVIIERPRGGARCGRPWPKTPWRDLDRDDDGLRDGGPAKLRMGPRRRSKWLTDHLGPLRRFLVSRIGRPWDEVHAEICACITVRSAVQKHVLDHLRRFVETRPRFIDGWPHRPVARLDGGYQPLWPDRCDFYVCPTTGRLQWPRGPRRGPDHIVRPLSDLRELRCISGVWFQIELSPLPADWQERRCCYDVRLKRRIGTSGMSGRGGLLRATYGREDVYAANKRQPRAQQLPHLLQQAERYAAALR
jgi:hypothetical protein